MRDVIDAEFQEVETPYRPFRFPWGSAVYFVLGVAVCCAAVTDAEVPTRVAGVICAALLWPSMRLFAQMGEQVSEREAQQLKRRLLHLSD